jgi:hypothetical protein
MKYLMILAFFATILSCNSTVDNNVIDKPSPNNTENKDSIHYLKHIDKEHGFSIEYLSQWDTTKKDPRTIFYAAEIISDTLDKFAEGANITLMPTNGASLDEVAEENIKMINQYYNNPKIQKAKTTNDNGILFITLSLAVNRNNLKLVSFCTFFIKNNNLYTLTQTTETKNMKRYGPIYQHVINSFNWTEN